MKLHSILFAIIAAIGITRGQKEGPKLEECESEVDPEWNIRWDTIVEGTTDEQPCPRFGADQDIVGSAKRKCLENGVWDEVDVINCANAAFADLEAQLEEGLQSDDPKERQDILAEVLPDLADAVTPKETNYIFPQDLVKSNDIVETVISQLAEDVEENVPSKLQTGVVVVLDKQLSEEHTDNWESVTSINNESDASLLLQNAENYAEYVALAILSESVETNDSVTLTEENIQLSAHMLDTTDYSDVVYPEDSAEGTQGAKIVIPSMHLSSRKASAVVNMRLENIENFLPMDEGTVAGAPVISSQVIAEIKSSNDTAPVQLTFTFLIKNARNPRCVYWDFTLRTWRTQGVTVVSIEHLESHSYKVTCESYHLTSFSVILDIVEEETDAYEFTTAAYVGAGVLAGGCLLLSLLFIVSLITSCIRQFKPLHVFHFAHLGLFISVMCSGVILLAGLTEATDNTAACTAVAALLQYFFTAAFTWALAISFLGLVAAASSVTFSQKWYIVLFIFGFGIPAIPTAISVGVLHDDYGNDAFCWVHVEEDEYSNRVLWANAGPMAAIAVVTLLVALLALLLSCIRSMRKTQTSDFKSYGLLCIETSAILLTVLVGGCWACGLLMVNDLWEPAEWVFMGCSIALCIFGLLRSLLLICGNDMMCNLFTANQTSEKDSAKYWSTNKPIVPETGQMQSAYAMKGTVPKSDSAYAMMDVPSDTDVEALMEAQKETKMEELETTTGDS